MVNGSFRVDEASRYEGKTVVLEGWVRHIRSSGSIVFIEVRDGTGYLQCVVVKNDVDSKFFEDACKLKIESSLVVKGTIRREKRAPGGFEMAVEELYPVHIPEEEYPISKKSHGIDFLLERRHLWIRSSRQVAILKIRSELSRILREYFYQNGFVLIDTPILTGSIGEEAGNLFTTEYFDFGKAFLAQTGQLYLEAAASSFKKVFCFGPTFRAEKSKTRRHLAEFWMLEAEMAFCDSEKNMDLQEDLICHVIDRVLVTCENELKFLERDLEPLKKIKKPFPRISYDEAVEILRNEGFSMEWGSDIGGDEETALSEKFDRPVFIYNYPRDVKAFYMKPVPGEENKVMCDDLFAPEGYGEIIGGSQRDDSYESLYEGIKRFGLNPDNYGWYLDLRKYGSVPHSGFGLGLERLVAWICKLPHVREAIPFPRLINRLYP